MKLLIIIFCIYFAGSEGFEYSKKSQDEWELFKATYNKTYQSELEEYFRKKIFMDNSFKVDQHNKLYNRGDVTFELGINQFSDLLHHEFVGSMNGLDKNRKPKSEERKSKNRIKFIPPIELPSEKDWRKKGAITPVKDQGTCRSCWSFSATGSLEAHHFLKTRHLVSLSEQNLVDCSRRFNNSGCASGVVDNAFKYIIVNRGIDTEDSYPYRAREMSCKFNYRHIGATLRAIRDVEPANEETLQQVVALVGPVSVNIDSSLDTFKQYASGVYYEPDCGSTNGDLNHSVLVVGYGTSDDGVDYWIVKNSWGTTWGEEGYFRMARNMGNNCGITLEAVYPLV